MQLDFTLVTKQLTYDAISKGVENPKNNITFFRIISHKNVFKEIKKLKYHRLKKNSIIAL